jgi:uncharacterized protein (TIGR00251 family)
MYLKIKVTPKASKNAIAGWLGEELKVMVTAAPEKGKANQAVITLLAEKLRIPKQTIRIVAGQTSARKTVEFTALDQEQLRQRLAVLA